MTEALALGVLAGRFAQRPELRSRRMLRDPTSFLMDRELVVQAAQGESILRLPWFEEDLFVGRQLPDVYEIPKPIRTLAVDNYRSALTGERGRYAFTSYGHRYSVEVVPVHGEDGRPDAVLAVAIPGRKQLDVAAACQRAAQHLERSASRAELAAKRHRLAGRPGADLEETQRGRRARDAAERARAQAETLRHSAASPDERPSLTPRETEVLSLASHGLTYAEIAEVLVLSEVTVKTHLGNVYSKLAVKDKAAAVAVALRYGLIE